MPEKIYFDRVNKKLTEAFSPSHMVIEDNSTEHRGHGGSHPDGETHFRITIVSEAFEAMSRAERHRAIFRVLQEELAERIHALSLIALSPREHTCGLY